MFGGSILSKLCEECVLGQEYGITIQTLRFIGAAPRVVGEMLRTSTMEAELVSIVWECDGPRTAL